VNTVAHDATTLQRWQETTAQAIRSGKAVTHAIAVADSLCALADCASTHPKLDGLVLTLYRPGTGVRGVYLTEAALVAHVFAEAGYSIAEVRIRYLQKSARWDGSTTRGELFTESNVTRRAAREGGVILTWARELQRAAEDRALTDDSYRCRHQCARCAPDRVRRADATSVTTLYKGKELARELIAEGLTTLSALDPGEKRFSPRQRIQIQSVVSGVTHVDTPELQTFLDRIVYPVFYLDFEAYARSVPPFSGMSPYEHTPVVAALDEEQTDGTVIHREFVAQPGIDERVRFFHWLRGILGAAGSIVVFSQGFESGMVRQLAACAGEPEVGTELIARMVDLLQPFADFAVYHPQQMGKVSLKYVLPAFTPSSYAESPVRDGMHANLSWLRHADRAIIERADAASDTVIDTEERGARAAESVSALLARLAGRDPDRIPSTDDIAAYCSIDTRAMVDLVATLRGLAGFSGG
jgi:hypothetical protein